MNKDEFCTFLRSVPKAEVHLHIEAVPTIETLRTLHKKRFGTELSDDAVSELFSYDDLNGFIQSFLKVQDMFTSADDFTYVFDDLAKYLVDNNVVYCEAFFAPSAFLKKGFAYPDMTAVFSRKIAEIKQKYGITVKLLLDVSRTFGCDNAMKNYSLLDEYPCSDVIGIGLGGAESKGPCRDFVPVFEKALKDGRHAVAHAGEDVGPESIWDAVNLLHTERIGHGITAIQDDKLMDSLKQSQIPLEVCVTSNVFTKKYVKSVAEHPIRAFYDRGLFVTVNTDDPVFFKTDLIEEYWRLYSECHFTLEQIKQLIENSFNALFISAEEKAAFCAQVEEAFNKAGV
ncbi:adenosine deaminase [Treponema porcinum]|uniref:adenosine deaminase n=1 Tax=Treponema porcinum TaxID=261392 RepID=UPI003F0F701D